MSNTYPSVLPTPAGLAFHALPQGIPTLRRELQARTGMFVASLDPDATPGDPGLFGPDSPTWHLTGQAAMLITGVRAALLQALSAPIPTATHATGSFAHDFLGRVGRTGAYVQAMNLGSLAEVHRALRRVRAMHRQVNGTAPDGTAYDATDPHQTAWVSMTFTDSILAACTAYGSGLGRAAADRFVAEQSRHGALLDHRVDIDELFADPDQIEAFRAGTLPLPLIDDGELPTTVAELRALMDAWVPELEITELTRALIDGTVQLTGLDDPVRRLARLAILAALWTMPDDLHDLVAPDGSRAEEFLASQLVQGPMAALQAVLGQSGSLRVARQRVAAAPKTSSEATAGRRRSA